MISREDYAGVVGTALESANRTFSQFRKGGLISISVRNLKIKDIRALKTMD